MRRFTRLPVRRPTSGAAALSRYLREGSDPDLRRRRAIVLLDLLGSCCLGVVSLYQLGLLRRLPEPPLPWLDAGRVDASAEAYSILSMPDGALALASYGLTICLAAMGGEGRPRDRPWLPIAMAVKALADAFGAVLLTREQVTIHRRVCSWCLLAAGASFVAAPLALPEATAAMREVCRRVRT